MEFGKINQELFQEEGFGFEKVTFEDSLLNEVGYAHSLLLDQSFYDEFNKLSYGEKQEIFLGIIGLTEPELDFIENNVNLNYRLITVINLTPSFKYKGIGEFVLEALENLYKSSQIILYPYPILSGFNAFDIQYARKVQEKIRNKYMTYGYITLENGLMIKRRS